MNDLLGYQGKNVVVTGAASGMGKAAAELLIELGAQVYALDIADVAAPVAKAIHVDMKVGASIDAAVEQIPREIDSLFNCAGVPNPPFSAEDVVLSNFSGLRYLTETVMPRIVDGGAIASIASTAGMGWRPNIDLVKEFLALDNSIETATEWLGKNVNRCAGGYGFSKQCIIFYTMAKAAELAQRSIRINCIAPSPTNSGFMDAMIGKGRVPSAAIDQFLPPNGRYADGNDMGEPLVLLNSKLAGFISGVNLPVDFGYCAQLYTGQREDLMGIAK